MNEQALTIRQDNPLQGGDPHYHLTIEQCMVAWLAAKVGRTQSAKTERAYRTAIAQFRQALLSTGFDLDSNPRTVALAAQAWAMRGEKKGSVSASTFNQRLAILSSFYTYAIKQGVCQQNPVGLVDRRPKQTKEAALPLDRDDVKWRLQQIDKDMPEGKRNYALLSLALATGRRAHELAGLRWEHLQVSGNTLIVTWAHCKGGKIMHDELKPRMANVLLSYLRSIYGPDLSSLPANAPVWISFSRNNKGGAICVQAIADICQKHLGTSKVHATRHTFAVAMEEAGAKLSDIGARLGHNDLKTTSEYMKRLHSAENTYASALEDMFGIE